MTAILALALGVRLIWAAFIEVRPVSDGVAFDTLARTLLEHGVFGYGPDAPTAYRSLGAPAVYAAAYWLFGAGALAVVVVNILASLAIVAGTFWLGGRIFSRDVGRIAALFVALWPSLIQFTTVIASELIFMAALLGSLWIWDRSVRGQAIWMLPAGVAFAATAMVKPVALLVPLALVAASLVRRTAQPWRTTCRGVIVTLILVATLVPWALRNEQAVGAPFLTTSNFWANVWIGNHAGASGVYVPPPRDFVASNEAERAAILRARVLEDMRTQPDVALARVIWKAVVFHRWETIGAVWNAQSLTERWGASAVTLAKAVSAAWWCGILGLAVVGMALVAQTYGMRALFTSAPLALWAYFTAVHAVVLVDDRLHMPVIPFVALFGGYAVTQWRRVVQTQTGVSPGQSAARVS